MFVDEVRVHARAGHGGKGCVAFLREPFRPKGGPSGGNGGRGGSVVLQADHDLNNLVAQYYKPRLIAEKGNQGGGKGMDGRAGKDLLVKVPCGTVVWRLPPRPAASPDSESADDGAQSLPPPLPSSTLERPRLVTDGSQAALEIDLEEPDTTSPAMAHARDKGEFVTDLTRHGEKFVLCRGGRGGMGNRNFATARRQTPRFAQPGEPGDEGDFLFELRLLAEVGLVGFPNAGKSTLLNAISRARPRVAPYPFTTLNPQVGIVDLPNYERLTVCDIPGLVEGAHRNVGLGHAFLRHIERCRVLVLILDMAGSDGRLPYEDYELLLREIELYDPLLLERPRLVAANKMDEPDAEKHLRAFRRRHKGVSVLRLAAAFDVGLDRLKREVRKALKEADANREPG